ncbi:MAG: hypothetical protein AB1728_05580 [Bacteroidota bacterium]
MKNIFVYAITYLHFILIAFSQDTIKIFNFPAVNKVDEKVLSNVVKIDTQFQTSYSIVSLMTSEQKIWAFDIPIETQIRNPTSPIGWIAITGRGVNRIGWGGRDSIFFIFPGNQLAGFGFESSGLPGIINYYVQGWISPPTLDFEPDSIVGGNFLNDSKKGKTIGVKQIPNPFVTTIFLDTLTSYTTQSRALGWITTQQIADKYLGYFATAKTQLQANNISGVTTTLQQVLTDVNVDSSSTLTSEAYALLRFNTEYLIAHLPPNKPENIQGVFPTPQSVTVTWTAEYSPTMLPNGGGYDLYRAIYYNGSVLSFTKLNSTLIAAATYTDNPVISPSIPADKNVYLKYYLIAKNNQGLNSVSSDTLSLFVGRTVSGAIASAASWNENKIVVGDVTVNNGASLSISPGVTVRFAGGKNLVSYGVLTAIGTPSQKITFTPLTTKTPGSWGSILMREAGAAGSAIEYAVVQYGNVLQVLNVQGTGVNVSHSTFDYAINAVRYTNSRGLISECFVNTPRDHGIQIESSSFASAYQNTITKTNKSGGGILFAGGGVGNAWKNSINGFNWGIGMYWGAAPMLGDTLNQGINNRITNCLRGLNIYNWAYPVVGYPSDIDDGMTYGNNIFGNTKNVYIYTTPDDTIFAQNVYWNSSNPVSTMYIGGSVLKFDYSNFLTDSTWQSAQPQAPFINRAKPSAAIQQSEVLLSGDERNLREGIKLRLKGKFTEAKNYFRSLVKNNPNNVQAFVELYKMLNTGEADEIEQTFVAYAKNSPAIVKMLQSFLFVKRGKISAAKLINSALMEEYPNSAISSRAAMNNFYIALYNENNLQQATKILKEISSKPELTTDVELSLAQHALDTYIAPRSTNRRSGQ